MAEAEDDTDKDAFREPLALFDVTGEFETEVVAERDTRADDEELTLLVAMVMDADAEAKAEGETLDDSVTMPVTGAEADPVALTDVDWVDFAEPVNTPDTDGLNVVVDDFVAIADVDTIAVNLDETVGTVVIVAEEESDPDDRLEREPGADTVTALDALDSAVGAPDFDAPIDAVAFAVNRLVKVTVRVEMAVALAIVEKVGKAVGVDEVDDIDDKELDLVVHADIVAEPVIDITGVVVKQLVSLGVEQLDDDAMGDGLEDDDAAALALAKSVESAEMDGFTDGEASLVIDDDGDSSADDEA